MNRRSSVLALACALVAVTGSDHARACEPIVVVQEVWPASGELAANAFAVVSGLNLRHREDLFVVLVDGQPVEFVVSERLSASSSSMPSQLALRPAVPPPIGATWTLQFDDDGEIEEVGTFTVVDPDVTAPAAPPASLSFDVHDFPNSECSSCGNPAVNYWPHFAAGVEDGGAPLVHALYVGHPDADDDQLVAVRRVELPASLHEALEPSWFANGQPVTEGVCFTLRLLDLAGNEAAGALRTCAPCHARIDAMQEMCGGFAVDEEPAWTDADLFPGGACEAEPVPPLPPEVSPEPEPDTTTGDATTGDASTGDASTGDASTSTASGGEPMPTTSGASTSDPPQPGGTTSAGGSSGESGDTAGETPDKAGCGCDEGGSSPWALAGLALVFRRRRPRGAGR